MKQTIEEIEVVGKRVLMRVDFNVPLQDGVITDDHRIRAALPSIQNVLDRGGTLTLISHLGRPSGDGFEKALSLQPVATRLSELLGQEVVLSDEDSTAPIILRENLRFNAGEKLGDEDFAKKLVEGADIYCNDAFGTAHRNHASMVAVPEVMQGKPRVAGVLLAKELLYLQDAVDNAKRPYIAVLGGSKVSDKMGAIERLLGKVDAILIGGAMAYTFLLARGEHVGTSLVEEHRVEDAAEMLLSAQASTTELVLPVDHVCVQQLVDGTPIEVVAGSIQEGWMGVDIGPETTAVFTHKLMHAKTIIWNGPMGVFEMEPFDVGTRQIAEAIASATRDGAISIIGGGDSAAAISAFGLENQMTHISTGGGASLQLLEGLAFSSVALLDDAV
jgi:phosphoglycerate kinase